MRQLSRFVMKGINQMKTTYRELLEEKEWLDDVLSNLEHYETKANEFWTCGFRDKTPENFDNYTFDDVLDFVFEKGYGSAEGIPIVVYTKEWVYFKGCYDGCEWFERLPRNPIKGFVPEPVGGG